MFDYIGLSGWARSGKDTVGEILEAHYGYHKMAYADVLRDFLVAQNALVRMDGREEYWTVSRIIDEFGWQGYKNSPFAQSLRKLIMETGTEAGRNIIGPTVWIDATLRNAANYDKVVITDVRFPNEAHAVLDAGINPAVWWIARPSVGPANDHASENSMNDFDFPVRIDNDSTIEELSRQVGNFLVD